MKRPRVALVRGPIVCTLRAANNEATPCIGIAYVAAYLRRFGYDVTIVDAIGEGLNQYWPFEKYPGYICQGLQFDELIDRIPPDVEVIGFSAMFSGEWPVQRLLINAIRARFPHVLLVAGGEHATALPEYTLRDCPAIDVCVCGEGEHTCYELLEAWTADGRFDGVSGIAYLDRDDRFVSNGSLPRITQLATIPWPYWPDGYLERFWAAGKSYGVCTERDMPMLISRGCPYQCTFCSSPQMWTTLYKLRPVDDVIDEIKHYREKYDITAVQLYDLTAIVKKSWTVEFCQRLVAEGLTLKWSLPSGTRSEALDSETLGYLKQTGCNYLVYAPESGSVDTLKRIKKKIHLDRVTASILEARRHRLILRVNLIIGFPDEARRDVFATLAYGVKLAFHGVDDVSANVFEPYPGSELFNTLLAEGRIKLTDRYFLGLTSMYSDLTQTDLITFNAEMSPQELGLWRAAFVVAAYLISYVWYPSRILRTARHVFSDSHEAATVFEHRLKDAVIRIKRLPKARRRSRPAAAGIQ